MMSLEGAIAVTRFGLGARQGEITIASRSPKAWLMSQIKPDGTKDEAVDNLTPSFEMYRVAKAYKRDSNDMSGDEKRAASKLYSKAIRANLQTEINARVIYAASTEAPFHERLTRFWSNHFSVSFRNLNTRIFVGAYEREAIRPHILGNFFDLASESVFHPAMLSFLDNVNSIGPGSLAGKRRKKGLNENLAREVLELHTVTPTAGYNQSDVTEFAKALTGWTIGRKRLDGEKIGKTIFDRRAHEPGTRKVLGKTYSQRGKLQAHAILKDICARPQTAENIALKLARHFISDTPPKELVEQLKASFLRTQGDLTAVYQTLINSPHAWKPEAQKVKTPEELIISTARMIGVKNVFPGRAQDSYINLAQPPFEAPTPEGWPDKAEAWIGPNAMMKRIEWANELASRLPGLDGREFLRTALGPRASKNTLEKVSQAASGKQTLVLAFMSPEYQRR